MDQSIIPKSAWFTRDIKQMGPVVVVMFVLLGVVVKLAVSPNMDHKEIIEQQKLGNYLMWANCTSISLLIEDPAMRDDAVRRCVPPPEKRPADESDQAFIFKTEKAVAMERTKKSSSSSSSGSSSSDRTTEMILDQTSKITTAIEQSGFTSRPQ